MILIADGYPINSNQRFDLTSQEKPYGYAMLPQLKGTRASMSRVLS